MISIHALCEEGDPFRFEMGNSGKEFLSTPSARRATKATVTKTFTFTFLSTPSARRATVSCL